MLNIVSICSGLKKKFGPYVTEIFVSGMARLGREKSTEWSELCRHNSDTDIWSDRFAERQTKYLTKKWK